MERWKAVPGFEGSYEVSDQGRVRSLPGRVQRIGPKGTPYTIPRKGQILRPAKNMRSGHMTVVLGRAGGIRYVHQLVLEAFVGECPKGHECRHRNGLPGDNVLSNLLWATRGRNLQDRKRHDGTTRYILSPTDVVEIKNRLSRRERQQDIADRYGVCRATIGAISTGLIHRDVVVA